MVPNKIWFTATCLFSENVCALLCGSTSDDRTAELEKLYNKESVNFNTNCPKVNRVLNVELHIPSRNTGSTRDSNCK